MNRWTNSITKSIKKVWRKRQTRTFKMNIMFEFNMSLGSFFCIRWHPMQELLNGWESVQWLQISMRLLFRSYPAVIPPARGWCTPFKMKFFTSEESPRMSIFPNIFTSLLSFVLVFMCITLYIEEHKMIYLWYVCCLYIIMFNILILSDIVNFHFFFLSFSFLHTFLSYFVFSFHLCFLSGLWQSSQHNIISSESHSHFAFNM